MFSNIDSIELARILFDRFGMGGEVPKKYKKEVDKFLSEYPTRIEALSRIGELCEGHNSPKALYIKTKAYNWAGAKFRNEAIKASLQYLSGESWNELTSDKITLYGYEIDQKIANIADIWDILGSSYEGEYLFDEALNAYYKAVELCPYFISHHIKVSNVLVKLNKKEQALEYLTALRTSKYYIEYKEKRSDGNDFIENSFITVLEHEISDIKEKINTNYVYKPRKKV